MYIAIQRKKCITKYLSNFPKAQQEKEIKNKTQKVHAHTSSKGKLEN
jgi:hypothetical protein